MGLEVSWRWRHPPEEKVKAPPEKSITIYYSRKLQTISVFVPSPSLAKACVCGLTRTTLRTDAGDPANTASVSRVSISESDSLAPSRVTTNFGLPARCPSFILNTQTHNHIVSSSKSRESLKSNANCATFYSTTFPDCFDNLLQKLNNSHAQLPWTISVKTSTNSTIVKNTFKNSKYEGFLVQWYGFFSRHRSCHLLKKLIM